MASPAFLIGFTAFFIVAVNAAAPPLCPPVQPIANFNTTRASGQWFVQMVGSHGTNIPQIKCEMRTLTPINNGGYIDVHIDFLRNDLNAEAFETNDLLVPQSSNAAYLDVQYSLGNNTQIVIDTDYETYAIWVDCIQLGNSVGYSVVVMTADRQITDQMKSSLIAKVTANNLSDGLYAMVQTNCRKTY